MICTHKMSGSPRPLPPHNLCGCFSFEGSRSQRRQEIQLLDFSLGKGDSSTLRGTVTRGRSPGIGGMTTAVGPSANTRHSLNVSLPYG